MKWIDKDKEGYPPKGQNVIIAVAFQGTLSRCSSSILGWR